MEVKPGYKQTEIGVIPVEWDVKPLGRVGKALIGLTYRPEDVREHGTLVLRSSNIQDGTLRFDDNVFVEKEIPARIMVRLDDVLVCVRNGSRDLIGKSALLDERTCGMTFGAFMAVFRCSHGRFVNYLFQSEFFKKQVNEHLGATINQITNKSLNSFVIPFPPTDVEQRAIVEALSDMDALLGGLDRLIAKKHDLRQAAMQQLLTCRTRLPGFHGEWGVKRIADIASPKSEKNVTGDKLPVLTCSKHLGFVDSLGFFRNQVFSKDLRGYKAIRRGEIGYPANHVEEGSIGLQNLYDVALVSPIYVVFEVAEFINSFFLHRLLKLDSYRQRFRTATTSSIDRRGSLRWPTFSQITVRVPSRSEQTAIAEVLTEMDAELAVLEQRREKTRDLKQAMMQELLTGRIRLVTPAASAPEKSHNWAINEAVVIAVLVKHFADERFPLGRKRCTKLSYLLHRHVEHAAQGYLKKAAGPYNPAIKYRGPEKIAQENGYIRPHKNGNFSGYIAADKIAQAESYFRKWYGLDVLRWLEQFRLKTNDELELLTTIDMAMQDLASRGGAADLRTVKEVIYGHPEWEAKLSRSIFSDSNIESAIAACGKLFAS